MKIAVLADLHLSDNFNTVKMTALQWAPQEVQAGQCDLICCAGDLTAEGTDKQTDEVLRLLQSCPVPFCSTPGNAELRRFSDGRNACKFAVEAPAGVPVILIDTALDEPTPAELAKLAALPAQSGFLLVTHNPIRQWSESAQQIAREAMQRNAVTAVIAGHSHHDADGILRGLDPDKASGGAPMFAVMEQQPDGSWQRRDVVMPGISPEEWSDSEREAFRRRIGISTMWEEVAALEFATEHRIENVELRMELNCPPELPVLIEKWRSAGGKVLSLHLPDLRLDDPEDKLHKYVLCACKLQCNRVTLHVPKVTAAGFVAVQEQLLDKLSGDMQMLLQNNIVVGIENLHTTGSANTFETRNFGCCIDECRSWIELLRQRFATDKIGFHLDIGHARNNAPISGRENLSDWYERMGDLINGWHWHQVEHREGKFFNHCPLKGFYDKLIVLSGFFMAQAAGQLRNAPIFLEARTWAGNVESYQNLMQNLKKERLGK